MAEQVLVRAKQPISARWVKGILKFAQKKPLGAFGAGGLILMILIAIWAPVIETYDPTASQGAVYRLKPPGTIGPGGPFIMGSDRYARDVFSRVVHGSRISLQVGIIAVSVGVTIGTLLGVASGYVGGAFDLVFQRFVDTAIGFPSLVLAMLLVAALGSSLTAVIMAITLSFIPRFIRLSRSAALSVRELDYVTAARALGAPGLRILMQHVLPNSITAVIVLATGLLGTAIITEASLSFLGLGVPPPHPAWGRLLLEAQQAQLEVAPWMAIFPGLALTITVYGFNLFGDALRDVLDPRLRGA